MIVSVFEVSTNELTTGVDPLKVIWTVVFSVVHSVNALTRTISFLWIGRPSKLKSIFLSVRLMNSITFCLYKKVLKVIFGVDSVVAVLYVTLFNNEVPSIVSLFTVMSDWALLVVIIEQAADKPTPIEL